MKYFKGSRRKVRKSSSLLEDASTSEQGADPLEDEGTPKKRLRHSENTESAHSKNKSHHDASKSGTQKTVKEVERKETGKDESSALMETADQSNNQLVQSDELSDVNFNLPDKSDSLVVHYVDEHQSDRDFLQQQIKILKTPFEVEVDCPALAKIRDDPKHIPLEVINSTLRKVNNKAEDEIMRSLNRPAQRKILSNLQDTRSDQRDSESSVSDEHVLKSYNEIQARVAKVEELHSNVKQKYAEHKQLCFLVSQLEGASEEFNRKTLIEKVKRTNAANLGVNRGSSFVKNAPLTHQQLVQFLFKDG